MNHSFRVAWLAPGILLASLLGSAWALGGALPARPGPVVTSAAPRLTQAANLPANQPASTGLALLFLLDESGGMNGACGDPLKVLTVDQPGQRYQFLNFFLQAMVGLHDVKDGVIDPLANPLTIGVGQFADRLQIIWPFTAPQALALPFPTQPVVLPQPLDACKTDFPTALAAAGGQLLAQAEPQRALVLITDGSFIGNQGLSTTAAIRLDAQAKTEAALTDLTAAGIKVYVLILGRSACRTTEQPCSLSATEKLLRNADLAAWEDWGRPSNSADAQLITLLDESRPYQSLLEDIDPVRARLPAAHGWAQAGQPGTITIFDHVTDLTINLITDRPMAASAVRLAAGHFYEAPSHSFSDQWFRWNLNATDGPLPPEANQCQSKTWEIGGAEDGTAYYWYDTHIATPGITELFIADGQPTRALNAGQSLPVSVRLDIPPVMQAAACYSMQLTLAQPDAPPQVIPFAGLQAQVTQAFTLSSACQRRTVTATLALDGEDAIGAQKVNIQTLVTAVEVYYEPEVQPALIAPANHQAAFTVTIPIAYMAPACNPELQPTITLTQTGNTRPPNCHLTGPETLYALDPPAQPPDGLVKVARQVAGNDMLYQIMFLAPAELDNYWDCGFRTLLVAVPGQLPVEIQLGPPLTPVTVTATPTLAPTPTICPGCTSEGGARNYWLLAIVVIGAAVSVLLYLKKRS